MARNVSGRRRVKRDTTRPPAQRSRRDAARRQVRQVRQVMTDIMRTLGTAIGEMTEPALEKISQEQAADPFQVLVGTMLSAQTRDPVTLAASKRLFERGPDSPHAGPASGEGHRAPDLPGELLPA